MARRKTKSKPVETDGDSGFVLEPESNAVVVRVPVQFYRRNGRQMILAKDDASGTNQHATSAPNNVLVANLAKVYKWQEQLESGEYGSFDELARAHKVDRTYVARLLRLTSLEPTMVDRILAGEWEVSLRNLMKGVGLVWNEGT